MVSRTVTPENKSLEDRISALEGRLKRVESRGDEFEFEEESSLEEVDLYGDYTTPVEPVTPLPKKMGAPQKMPDFEQRRDSYVKWVEAFWPEFEEVTSPPAGSVEEFRLKLLHRFPNRDDDWLFQMLLANVSGLHSFLKSKGNTRDPRRAANVLAGLSGGLKWSYSVARGIRNPSKERVHFRAMQEHIRRHHPAWYRELTAESSQAEALAKVPPGCPECERFSNRPERIIPAIQVRPYCASQEPVHTLASTGHPCNNGVSPMPLSLPEYVARWKASTLTERAAAQSHFIDLCEVLGQPHPAAADQTGDSFTFEKHVSKLKGGKGYADVWKRGFFAWEYKGKHKDLQAAYLQLADYREDLENPPLLVVCDQDRFEVHTNFTGTAPNVYSFTLDDLLSASPTPNCALPPLEVLRAVFTAPEQLKPEHAALRVTEQVSAEFGALALSLRARGEDPERAAHFLMRLLFCLFADSIGLLPEHLFRQMIAVDAGRPASFRRKLRQLFSAMSTRGNNFGALDIAWFNGGLFADDEALELIAPDMATLRKAAALDWSNVEPSVFGTLFERSLDPGKRSQIGAHYTSRQDILLIVEPVVMAPLEVRWAEVKADATALAKAAAKVKGAAYNKLREQMQGKLYAWVEELAHVRILDPACGSGNFLYLALKRMLDLWQEARIFAADHGLPTVLPEQVHPSQLYGLELNTYAHQLASVVVWIGYLQWLQDHGMGVPTEPILRKLDNIQHRDAILAHDSAGKPVETQWPDADFIIGNPPFLGDKKMRAELGDDYVSALRRLYAERVPGGADLVTYWFEKARAQIAAGKAKRAGLLATNSIRMVGNRPVLERIKDSGGIFMAWSDRPWILDGAAVRVSIVGFDDGSQTSAVLDGTLVKTIHADLSAESNVASAVALEENSGLCFLGVMKAGPFDITAEQAKTMLGAPLNPNGRPNSDVVKRRLIGRDIVQQSQDGWLIDFGEMPESQAALYELPFEYVKREVKPLRDTNNRKRTRERWWLHGENRPGLRRALVGKSRCIVTPEVAKHRIFVWMSTGTVPDHTCHVIAWADDYAFGLLHSKPHELWSLSQGAWMGIGNDPRYSSARTFETFPFPWAPGKESQDDPLVQAIAQAASELVTKRDAWLNPPDAKPETLSKRTLTNLYNERPSWLAEAHRKLDEAVFAAYGWPSSLTDAEVLERLLALNHERAALQV